MRIFFILVFYSLGLFLVGYFMLDFESMIVNELSSQFEMPDNVLLKMLEDMQYWNKFSILFTFLLLTVKCFLMALVL